jgi:AraC-like DNA-binding protein
MARRFHHGVHMAWQQWLSTAQMLRAMELLSVQDTRVTETAFAVGYGSLSTFSTAFTAFASEIPRAFHQRFDDATAH